MPDAAAHADPHAAALPPAAPPVYVIGGGPGGLATAAALQAYGVRAVVLEKSDAVGASWRRHYDRLRLHTTRRLSALPGLPIPRAYGRWVARDDVVRYLEQYARYHRLEIVTGVEVRRIDRAGGADAGRADASGRAAAATAGAQPGAGTNAQVSVAVGAAGTAGRADPAAGGTGATVGAGRPASPERAASPGRPAGTTAGGAGDEAACRAMGQPPGTGGWVLHANGGRALRSPSVVVATGYNHTPYLPNWPGRTGYTGTLLHAAHYRNALPYAGKDVLVVGTGNTGAEIAVDLAHGGAARVRLAVRTPPHIVRRSTAGWPAQATGILIRHLPPWAVDAAARAVAHLAVPDLTGYGLPAPETGLYTRALQGAIPVQDVGLIEAVQAGAVQPVAAVESFDGGTVRLAGGDAIDPDVVIAATGYRRGLDTLVGHLGVLDARGNPLAHGPDTLPRAPGLRFTGYTNPISGMFRELALDACRIARAVVRDEASAHALAAL
ncbi:NAD(P)/FAD-dependent oxidoreductase [Streptomyces sp. MST-110588]|uniref:flavin-containing monooxygenase n=1 Tax=Streptomyces sp. MST-110588 TaxID=2833628 RepID=UPI001F5C7791|nr:NAD(P)/FAD-dependent oxidoreductase [Streptomyces sp. MST-110588]UNO41418.1 NAD(P)/FAD-dependent oxidoreductase [Streptomyces sp. MST-110588]